MRQRPLPDALYELVVTSPTRAQAVGLDIAAHAGRALIRSQLRPHETAVAAIKTARACLEGKGDLRACNEATLRLDLNKDKADAHVFHERAVRQAVGAVIRQEWGNQLYTSLLSAASYAVVCALVAPGLDESGAGAARKEEAWQRRRVDAALQGLPPLCDNTRDRISLLAN